MSRWDKKALNDSAGMDKIKELGTFTVKIALINLRHARSDSRDPLRDAVQEHVDKVFGKRIFTVTVRDKSVELHWQERSTRSGWGYEYKEFNFGLSAKDWQWYTTHKRGQPVNPTTITLIYSPYQETLNEVPMGDKGTYV